MLAESHLIALKTHFCILVYNILSSLTYLPYDENLPMMKCIGTYMVLHNWLI